MEYDTETFNKWRVHYVMAWPSSDDSYYGDYFYDARL